MLALLPLLLVFAGCSKILAYPEVHPPEDGDADVDDGLDAADVETDRDAADDGGEDLDAVEDEMQDAVDVQDADEVESEVCEPGSTWALSFDTNLPDSAGAAVLKTPEGHLVVAASTMNGGIGGSDILVVKVDGCGTVLAAMAVGLTGDDTASDMVRISDGSLVVVGTTSYFIDSGHDAWILKLDSDLTEVLWQRALATDADETIAAITATADNRFAVVGTYTHDAGSSEMYVALVASNGDPIWQRTFGSEEHWEQALGVAEFGDRLFVAGSARDGDVDSEAWILCLDKSDGVPLWMNEMDVDGRWSAFSDVMITPTDAVLFAGSARGSGWFGELSIDDGNVIYSKEFGTETPGLGALPLNIALTDLDSGIAITGTAVDDEEGLDEMFLATLTGVDFPADVWLGLFGRDLADRPGSRGFAETVDGLVLAGWSEDLANQWQLVLIKMGGDGHIQDPCPLEGEQMGFTLWDSYNLFVREAFPSIYPIEEPFETTFASTRDMTGMETTFLCPAE